MARNCLSDSVRTTDFRFKTALENAAKDWDVLAAMMEFKEKREQDTPGPEVSRLAGKDVTMRHMVKRRPRL